MRLASKRESRQSRHKRVRARVMGTSEVPRLYVFRSSKHIYAQIINDDKSSTLASASDRELKVAGSVSKTKTKINQPDDAKLGAELLKTKIAAAYGVGKLIAEKGMKLKIQKVVFDRGGYKYHGRVKALAEGAREGGLKF